MSIRSSLSRVSKRKLAAIAAGVGVFAIVSASAATLGGLQTSSVGADSNTVASPVENGVTIDWDVAYDQNQHAYVISNVALTPVDTMETIPSSAEVRVTLTGASDAVLGEYVSQDGGNQWVVPTTLAAAHDVTGASVVVNGGDVTNVEIAQN